MDDSKPLTPVAPCLPHLVTKGTSYDVGYNTGVVFGSRIQLYLAKSKEMQKQLLPFYESRAGRDYYEESLRVSQDCFPRLVREVRGTSDGAGIPFEQLFMANLSKEVCNVLNPPQPWSENSSSGSRSTGKAPAGPTSSSHLSWPNDFGCSDVFLNLGADSQYLVHNEDCDPLIKPYGYLLTAAIEEDGVEEAFTAMCYPGILPGCAFSFNSHGVTFSMNGCYPDVIERNCPSRMFVNRSMLGARDVEDAVRLAQNAPYGVAYGFTANITTRQRHLAAVEVGPARPQGKVHVQHVTGPGDVTSGTSPSHYYHFNRFNHLQGYQIADHKVRSSTARQKRCEELPAPDSLQAALAVMADDLDPLYPIFRTPRPSDPAETVCTVVFDVTARQMAFYQGKQDLLNNKPFYKMPLY